MFKTERSVAVEFGLAIAFCHAVRAATAIENGVNDAGKIVTQRAVLGAICIAAGLFLVIVGQRLWKGALFCTGFFVTGLVAYILMVHFEPSDGYNHRGTVLLLGSLACGLVGGGTALCLWKIGLICLGATAGFLFGMFLLSWKSGGLADTQKGQIILLAVCTGVGAIAIGIFQKKLLVVATSIAGSYAVIFGVDEYARTGFTEAMQTFLSSPESPNWTEFERSRDVIILLCSMILLAIIGIVLQLKVTRKRDNW
ncbi:hypothetical protein HDU89_005305 [Geranomyces variabilis]|nr:hypothetical protein HDU89_005305 [Geranomyces variabilis]